MTEKERNTLKEETLQQLSKEVSVKLGDSSKKIIEHALDILITKLTGEKNGTH